MPRNCDQTLTERAIWPGKIDFALRNDEDADLGARCLRAPTGERSGRTCLAIPLTDWDCMRSNATRLTSRAFSQLERRVGWEATMTAKNEMLPKRQARFSIRTCPKSVASDQLDVGDWELCFAWHPVRLYATGRFVWLRKISKRPVFIGTYHLKTDYSDVPSNFPLN